MLLAGQELSHLHSALAVANSVDLTPRATLEVNELIYDATDLFCEGTLYVTRRKFDEFFGRYCG